MTLRTEIEDGLARIGVATGRPYSPSELGVFADVLVDQVSPGEFGPFVMAQLKASRWKFKPNLSEVQDALREYRGAPSLQAEATQAYERVLKSGIYSPEGGTTWDYRTIKQLCGEAAAEAFLAAGGSSAFETTIKADTRRERFIQAYSVEVRADASSALLPAGKDRKALPAPPAAGDISKQQAAEILKEIARKAGQA